MQLWWKAHCTSETAFVSKYVSDEIEERDPLSARHRLKSIRSLPRCSDNVRVRSVSELLISGGGLMANARKAAEHIACAALNNSDIVLTWNCIDMANARKLPLLRILMNAEELLLPELVTPFELMENSYENL
jgi:hypothetical protein